MDLTLAVRDEDELRKFLDDLENRLENIEVEYGETLWKKYLREPCGDLNEIERKRSKILLKDEYFQIIKEWKSKVQDVLLTKRLRALERIFLGERIEALPDVFSARNKINEEHIAFKPLVFGKRMDRTDVYEILRKEPDATKRKVAWESFSELSRKIENDVAELMKLRNKHAEELGYETYVEYALSQILVDKDELLKLFNKLDELTRTPVHEVLKEVKEKLGIESLEPWDISYVMDQFVKPPDEHFPKDLILSKIKGLVKSWGLNPDDLPILIKEADIPFGGLCFGIKIPTDIRIVFNPRDGHRFYTTLFHEYGHALHGCFINQPSYALKVEVGCFAEGMARIMEHFTSDYEWLRENTSLSDNEIKRFTKAQKALRLLRIRNLIGASVFEYQTYENPDQDLNKLLSKIRAKYMFVSENETPQWAAQSIYTTHPIYVQNYVLAEMIAAQTIEYLKEKYGNLLNNAQVLKFLKENYYGPGGSVDWPEKVRQATGKKLDVDALVKQLLG